MILAPEQPSGCPNAIAPPLRFSLFIGQSPLRITKSDWAANASLSSIANSSRSPEPRLCDRRQLYTTSRPSSDICK